MGEAIECSLCAGHRQTHCMDVTDSKDRGAGVCLLLTSVMWSIYITSLRFSISLMQIWIFAWTH